MNGLMEAASVCLKCGQEHPDEQDQHRGGQKNSDDMDNNGI